MSDQNLDYAAIRRNVNKNMYRQKRLYRRIFFGTHLVVFLVAMAAMWGTVITDSQLRTYLFGSESSAAVIVILPTILWALAILFHIAALYTESPAGEKAMREQLLTREIGEEIMRKGLMDQQVFEKRKRSAPLTATDKVLLTDDGELAALDETDEAEESAVSSNANHARSAK